MYGIIYKITNKVDGKTYIGQTMGVLRRRWQKHCRKNSRCHYLYNAIQKYGEDGFDKIIVDTAETKEELNEKENHYIQLFNSLAPNGYNLKTTGNQGIYSEESRKKMSKSATGKPGYWTGKHHSDETKELLSKINTSKKHNEKSKKKMSEAQNFKKVKILCHQNGIIYESMNSAMKALGVPYQSIQQQLSGKAKIAKGYTFERLPK